MKKKWLALLLCVAAAAGCLYAAILHKHSTKEEVINYVQANRAALEQFAFGLLEDPAGETRYNGWQVSCYQDAGMVEFITKGTGIGALVLVPNKLLARGRTDGKDCCPDRDVHLHIWPERLCARSWEQRSGPPHSGLYRR